MHVGTATVMCARLQSYVHGYIACVHGYSHLYMHSYIAFRPGYSHVFTATVYVRTAQSFVYGFSACVLCYMAYVRRFSTCVQGVCICTWL